MATHNNIKFLPLVPMKLIEPEYPSIPYLALDRQGIQVITRTESIFPAKVPHTAVQKSVNRARDAPIKKHHVAIVKPILIAVLSAKLYTLYFL